MPVTVGMGERVALGGAWTPCRTWAAGPSRGAVSPCRPNPPNRAGSSNGESWWALGYRMSGTQTTQHGPRAAVTKLAQLPLGKLQSWWHQASLLPSAVRDKDARPSAGFLASKLSRDNKRRAPRLGSWGHPLWRSSKVRGEEGTAHADPAQQTTLTGWPGAGSTSRQLLFSHRQLWGSLTLATIHSTACILPSRPWLQDQTQEVPGARQPGSPI